MSDTNQEILLKLKAIDEITPVMLKALQAMEANSARMAETLDRVSAAAKHTEDNTEGLHGKTVTLAAAFHLVKEGAELVEAAFSKVEQQVEKAIETAVEGEKSYLQLKGALVSTGQFTKEAANGVREWAEAQEKARGISSDLSVSIVSQGLQMGLSIEKAKEMEAATEKLSEATGKSLQEAMSLMTSSLSGQARQLGRHVQGIKELSAAQLRAGAAIDIVNQSLAGFGKNMDDTYVGAMRRYDAGLGNIYKEIGNMIIQSPIVRQAINAIADVMFSISEAIASANKFIQAHQEQIKELGNGIRSGRENHRCRPRCNRRRDARHRRAGAGYGGGHVAHSAGNRRCGTGCRRPHRCILQMAWAV
jgi:hypothetical protein